MNSQPVKALLAVGLYDSVSILATDSATMLDDMLDVVCTDEASNVGLDNLPTEWGVYVWQGTITWRRESFESDVQEISYHGQVRPATAADYKELWPATQRLLAARYRAERLADDKEEEQGR